MTDPLISIVSPVFTVGGTLIRNLARDCVQLEVEEGIEGLRTMRADFVAIGAGATGPPDALLHLDGQTLDFGKRIAVTVGPSQRQRIVFDGIVSALEVVFADSEPPRLVVFAEDALMQLRMTRRMRTYTHVTDADIARQIAKDHEPPLGRGRSTAPGTTSSSSSTRATWRSCANGPAGSRPSCGRRATPALRHPATRRGTSV